MSVLDDIQKSFDKVADWFRPRLSQEEAEKALGEEAERLEALAEHAEKVATLRERISSAEKRIVKAKAKSTETGKQGVFGGAPKVLLVLVVIVIAVLIAAKSCS
jgi:hypothetical protein